MKEPIVLHRPRTYLWPILTLFPWLTAAVPASAAEPATPTAAERPAEPGADASKSSPPAAATPLRVNELTVVGTKEKQTAGSAHIVKSRELERFEHDDSQQVLKQVPGVYARGEDGVGLRPNIGIRGVNPDRSKKVTLMEDGVLFAPAPYSAPAAYYFPLMTRMDAVRVIKGPGSVSFGPQTVGGAVDLVTRPIPKRLSAALDLGGGQYGYGKGHGHVGWSSRRFGVLVEGVHLRSSGFKELDGGGDTGFARNELMAKGRWVLQPGARVHNEIELKLGYSTEDSDETYLGLSDEDFQRNPLRRYAASRGDHMNWQRSQVVLRHVVDFGSGRSVETALYRHDFHRVWRKINRFGSADIASVLRAPQTERNKIFMRLLGLDPGLSTEETLYIGPNDRRFVSQGVTTVGSTRWAGEGWENRAELGLRLHYDHLDRKHSEDPFVLNAGKLERGPGATIVTSDGLNSALALAAHASDAFTRGRLTVTPGLRFELINMKTEDRLPVGGQLAPRGSSWQTAFVPGIGAYYALFPSFGVLGGAYRGFSPIAPGQPAGTLPESSWNYEGGARMTGDWGRAEVIGFYNDYSNIVSYCTLASGCAAEQIDRQYNGSSAAISGVEVYAQSQLRPMKGVQLPLGLAYTFTRTSFGTTFMSEDPQYGMVKEGDELPYVPRHQASLTAGLETRWLGLQAAMSYTSAMREQAGAGPLVPQLSTDSSLTFEAGARGYVSSSAQIYLHVRNLTNALDVAARRPFGARPISPRWIQAGLKVNY